MAYQKKSPEEVSEARRKAALARKNCKGGRPKGSVNKNRNMELVGPSRSMLVREADHAVFAKLAYIRRQTLVEFLHSVAESLKSKNPKIFQPEPPPEVEM